MSQGRRQDFAWVGVSPGGYSGFQVTGMIEWEQKSRPKEIPRASNKTQKNPLTKNFTLEFMQVCFFIIPSEFILPLSCSHFNNTIDTQEHFL